MIKFSTVFRSLKSRLLVFIAALIIVSFVSFLFFAYRAEDELIETADIVAHQQLKSAVDRISNSYESLIRHRDHSLRERKDQLRTAVNMIVNQLDRVSQNAALESIKDARFGNHGILFLYDHNVTALVDTNSSPKRVFIHNLPKMTSVSGDAFFTAASTLNYVKFYRPWRWYIGGTIDINDVDSEMEAGIQKLLLELRSDFGASGIDGYPYFFLFDGKGKILIPPVLAGQLLSQPGPDQLHRFMEASKHPEKALLYDTPRSTHAYAGYFQPLNWYVVSNVVVSSAKAPVRKLVSLQTLTIFLLLICGLAIASVFADRLIGAIKLLTHYARSVLRDNFAAAQDMEKAIGRVGLTSGDEIADFSRAFSEMISALPEDKTNPGSLKMKIENGAHELNRLNESLQKFCEVNGIPSKTLFDLMLIFEEVLNQTEGPISLHLEKRMNDIAVTMQDDGRVTERPDDRLQLLRNLSDQMSFRRSGNSNILTFHHRIETPDNDQ